MKTRCFLDVIFHMPAHPYICHNCKRNRRNFQGFQASWPCTNCGKCLPLLPPLSSLLSLSLSLSLSTPFPHYLLSRLALRIGYTKIYERERETLLVGHSMILWYTAELSLSLSLSLFSAMTRTSDAQPVIFMMTPCASRIDATKKKNHR